jgi:hypothetical protein
VTPNIGIGLGLALLSAAALNWGWVAQHTAASGLPPLAIRRPVESLRSLFRHRGWVIGFATGLGGWALYIAALALAPLSLVQAVAAGGIGLLALLARRTAPTQPPRREWAAVAVSIAGLVLLAVSLAGGSTAGRHGSPAVIAGCLVGSAVLATLLAGPIGTALASGAGLGLAAGVLYGAGDLATKGALGGGLWLVLVPAVLAAHGLAFVALQFGFQRGGALVTAGTATLFTNALPIAAGIAVFHERLPGGVLGLLRLVAFALVVVGAALLARAEGPARPGETLAENLGAATV